MKPDKIITMIPGIVLLLLVTTAASVTPVFADQEAGVSWAELTTDEKKVLNRFSEKWQELPRETQDKLRRGARRWQKMSSEERKLARKRMERWKEMSPEVREKVRQKFKRFQQLPEEERRKLRKTSRWFQNLSPEKKERLKARWQSKSPAQPQESRDWGGNADRDGRSEPSRDVPGGRGISRGVSPAGRR